MRAYKYKKHNFKNKDEVKLAFLSNENMFVIGRSGVYHKVDSEHLACVLFESGQLLIGECWTKRIPDHGAYVFSGSSIIVIKNSDIERYSNGVVRVIKRVGKYSADGLPIYEYTDPDSYTPLTRSQFKSHIESEIDKLNKIYDKCK